MKSLAELWEDMESIKEEIEGLNKEYEELARQRGKLLAYEIKAG